MQYSSAVAYDLNVDKYQLADNRENLSAPATSTSYNRWGRKQPR